MRVFKFTRVRMDGRKQFENCYVWTPALVSRAIKIFTRYQNYTGTCRRGLKYQLTKLLDVVLYKHYFIHRNTVGLNMRVQMPLGINRDLMFDYHPRVF